MTDSRNQFLVTVESVADFWASADAVTTTSSTKRVWNGGDRDPDILQGRSQHGTLNVMRPWSRSRDLPILNRLRPLADTGLYLTITKQPTDPNLRASGGGIKYRGLLTAVKDPEASAGAETDEATFTLTFEIQSVSST